MASVTLEHLSKIYSNGFVSVNDVSLRVDNGEFITLHGPSGCGKSTILRMIGGLEDITSGKIYLSEFWGRRSRRFLKETSKKSLSDARLSASRKSSS